MNYFLLFLIAPAAASFMIQIILCCKIKNRILRHGTLVLPMIFIVFGSITLTTQHGNIYSGLSVIEAVLLFVSACCATFGYGAAWAMVLLVKHRRTKKQKKIEYFSNL